MSIFNSPIPCQDHNLEGEGTKGDIAIGNTSWSGGRWCMECRHFYKSDIQLLWQDRFSSALKVLLVAWKTNWCFIIPGSRLWWNAKAFFSLRALFNLEPHDRQIVWSKKSSRGGRKENMNQNAEFHEGNQCFQNNLALCALTFKIIVLAWNRWQRFSF